MGKVTKIWHILFHRIWKITFQISQVQMKLISRKKNSIMKLISRKFFLAKMKTIAFFSNQTLALEERQHYFTYILWAYFFNIIYVSSILSTIRFSKIFPVLFLLKNVSCLNLWINAGCENKTGKRFVFALKKYVENFKIMWFCKFYSALLSCKRGNSAENEVEN